MLERESLMGFSQQMLAQYIATLNVTEEIPGRALLLKVCSNIKGMIVIALSEVSRNTHKIRLVTRM